MGNIAGKLLYIYDRLKEPSSSAALLALLAMYGKDLPPGLWDTIINVSALGFGILGVFVAEGKPETKVEGF